MTAIRALPPTYYVMTDNLQTSASSQDRMIAGDFQTILKAQNKIASTSSSDSVKKLSQQQSADNAINQKNVEAVLAQLLAGRKTFLNATGKVLRSTSENGVCSDSSDLVDIEPACKEQHIVCHAIQHSDFCGYEYLYNMPVGCAVTIPIAPVIYIGYTFIWTPIDIIRRDVSRYASGSYHKLHKLHKPRFRFNSLSE